MTINQLINIARKTNPEMAEYLDVLESEAERYAEHLAGMNLEDAILKLCDESFLMNELFTEEERVYCGQFLYVWINQQA
ncbi:hypothetical protein [Vibrio quintilis]|uniref:Uncharacterized protein n=1 Tax=Vibrio quintilis TaxID=1117707 RepID=A0A1M7YP27_9VIBR|nr:hypothetical protein [Vibrio quintilis]SHO54393.1 hypothetical protein VQ7734_00107 [Vibrio quintilis]